MFKCQSVLLSQMIGFRGTATFIVYLASKLFGEVFEHGSTANYHLLFSPVPRLQQCPAVKPVNSNNLSILCAPISATCCIHTATNSIGKLASKSRNGISSIQMPLTRSRGQSYVSFPKTLPRPQRNQTTMTRHNQAKNVQSEVFCS